MYWGGEGELPLVLEHCHSLGTGLGVDLGFVVAVVLVARKGKTGLITTTNNDSSFDIITK